MKKMASSQMKEVEISCGTKTKLVNIDIGNFEETVAIIRGTFNIPQAFDFKAVNGDKGVEYDIENDNELRRFKDAKSFVVRPIAFQPQITGAAEVAACSLPPTYEQSLVPQQITQVKTPPRVEASEEKVTIDFRGKKKAVKIDRNSVKKTRDAVRRRFNIQGVFSLQGKQETGEFLELDDEEDLEELRNAEAFIIPENDAVDGATFGEKGAKDTEEKILVDYNGQKKSVGIYRNNVGKTRDVIRQRFSIQGDFSVQAKQPGKDEYLDIDDEEDVDELQQAEALRVSPCAAATGGRQLVPSGGQLLVSPNTASPSLEGMEVCAFQPEKTYTVQLNKVVYAVNEPPPANSLVVQREMQKLMSTFDIQGIIRQIDIVAMCLRIVLYGVVSNRELELKVVDMQSMIENLCNVSGRSVKQFGMKASTIMSQMQHGIECLMDGYGENAAEHFKKIVQTSTEMTNTADDLKTALENLIKSVVEVHSAVNETNTTHLESTKEAQASLTTEVKDGKKTLLEKKQEQTKRDREAAERRYATMPAGDDKTRVKAVLDQDKMNVGVCLCDPGVCCVICCDRGLLCNHKHCRFFYYLPDAITGMEKAEYRLLDRDKADRIEALQERDRLRIAEEAATQDLLDFTESLKNVDPSNDPEDVIERAFRGAEKAIKLLKSSVSLISGFWDTLRVQAGSIAGAGDGSIGIMKDEMDEATRNKFFKSRSFQVSAVEYLAKWVAMGMMCEAFTEAMEPIQRNLQLAISDTPNRQQALKKIPELVIGLDQKLAERKVKMKGDGEANALELKAIMAGAET